MQTYLNAKDVGFPVLEGGENIFIPLKQTKLTGNISIPFADLSLEQKFQFSSEEYKKTIEAVYRFPVAGNATVKDVYVKFGDVEIKTELKKRKKAEEDYEEAKEKGKQAALVSREAPNVFTLRVTGIHPDEIVEVRTHYVQILRPIDEGFEFRIPLTTAPRYVRDDELSSRHSKGEPLSLMIDPQHRFSMRVTINGASEIVSKTHDVDIKDNIAKISEVVPNKDLVLELKVAKKEHPSLRLITYEDPPFIYFGVLASPPSATKKVRSLSFVEEIDHSGSMQGPKWEISDFIAKMTYSEVKNISSEVYICAFDTNTWWIKVKDQKSLEKFLEKKYGGGGTHLGAAIEEGIHKHTNEDIAYNVIITDAQVSDYGRLFRLADLIREIKQRMIVICVDSAPNSYIPIEMARRAGGLCFFLSSGAKGDMINAVEHISRYWKEPLGHVEVKVSGENLTIEHSQGLHKNQKLELGDLTKSMARWGVGRVKGKVKSFDLFVDGEKVDEISLEEGEEQKVIKDVFGIHRVNYLECLINARYTPEDLSELLASIGYATKLEGGERIYEENKLKLTRENLDSLLAQTALEFGLASKETSFVAITEKEGKIEETLIVPNALPEGWVARSMPAPSLAAPSAPPSGARRFLKSASFSSFKRKETEIKRSNIMRDSLGGGGGIPKGPPKPKAIFEGKTKNGVFFQSKEVVKLSSIEVIGNVPKGSKIYIYLKNDSTPIATINLERVKMLGTRPLNIHGIVRIESNVEGVQVKIV